MNRRHPRPSLATVLAAADEADWTVLLPRVFRCRNCRRHWQREECSTRKGLLECSVCLQAFCLVGVLEAVVETPAVEGGVA